jgi:hypothetical protein
MTLASALAQESLSIATKYQLPIRKREAEEIVQKIADKNIDFSI